MQTRGVIHAAPNERREDWERVHELADAKKCIAAHVQEAVTEHEMIPPDVHVAAVIADEEADTRLILVPLAAPALSAADDASTDLTLPLH